MNRERADSVTTPRSDSPKVVAKKALYSGMVQGVGFRYAAKHCAGDFAVTGYVHNLPSGEVELVAEGEAGQVDAFLAQVAQRMAQYIREARVSTAAVQGFTEFSI